MIFREKFKTLKNVFDLFTEKNLFKLISQGHFRAIESPISIGKEANIFSALREDDSRLIIKIYRLNTCDFNQMYNYLKFDPRFRVKRSRREIVFLWAQREFRNLMLAREAGVRVPTPIVQLTNILVMEFIGTDTAASKLKDLHPSNPQEFFDDIVKNMRKLYKAKLVHADLSAFNILNHNDKPVFIDMSQTTSLEDINAENYLKRDVHNICVFFKKIKLDVDEEKVLEEIKK